MKGKLSATVEQPLIEFLDSLPGTTRSAKLEHLLTQYRLMEEERVLRKQLGQYREEEEERSEREIWERTMAEAMWNA